jgi:hypothetical protein
MIVFKAALAPVSSPTGRGFFQSPRIAVLFELADYVIRYRVTLSLAQAVL